MRASASIDYNSALCVTVQVVLVHTDPDGSPTNCEGEPSYYSAILVPSTFRKFLSFTISHFSGIYTIADPIFSLFSLKL